MEAKELDAPEVCVEVYRDSIPWGCDDDPSLPAVIAWLQARLEEIPEEFRDRSKCVFDTDYESSFVDLCIRYCRGPTEEELRAAAVDRSRKVSAVYQRLHAAELEVAWAKHELERLCGEG